MRRRGGAGLIGAVTTEPFFPDAALLHARGPAQQRWHDAARAAAEDRFGREVFLRGVVEVSNYCRENCDYCGMRRDNRALDRHRARLDALTELLLEQRPESVTDINLQAGEDPVVVREVVIPLVERLRRETALGVSVCLGSLSMELYRALQAAGATTYILKFEIANARQYAAFHAPGTHAERRAHIRLLAETGWNVSSGFIAGLPGQTDAELLENFALANELPLSGCSVSPFIPGEATPLAAAPAAGIDLTLNCMAALRLLRPDWVIPAVSALNLAEPGAGYRRGLRTGANLVTINLTPAELREDYLLYKRDRFIMTEERILQAIESEGLRLSRRSLAEFYREQRHASNDAVAPAELTVAVA